MQAGLRLVYNNNELGKFIDNKLMRIAHIKHLMQLLSIYHCVILNFQTPMSFPYFRQVQLKVYSKPGNMLKLTGMNFHVVTQP